MTTVCYGPRAMTIEIANRLARQLLEDGSLGVVSAYLFGSEAEGRSHRESDVDLGALLDRDAFPTPAARFEQRLQLISRLSSGLGGRSLDLVVLNDAPPLLGRHIVTRGRRLFCSDPVRDHAFVRDIQLRAADIEPFLRRMRRIKLDRISGS
jgi:predicted nucleotidyltransferase